MQLLFPNFDSKFQNFDPKFPNFVLKFRNFRDPDVPLVVDENIELPQLALIKNYTADCTQVTDPPRSHPHALRITESSLQVYSTGNFTCLEVVFVLKRRLGYYLFHTYIPTCLIVIMSVSCSRCSACNGSFKAFSSGSRSGSSRRRRRPG